VAVSALLVFLFIKEPKELAEQTETALSLKESINFIIHDTDKSALRILFAIFFGSLRITALRLFLPFMPEII